MKKLTIYELETISGGFNWSGTIAGCGSTMYEAAQVVNWGIHLMPPHVRAIYLGGACFAGGVFGGATP